MASEKKRRESFTFSDTDPDQPMTEKEEFGDILLRIFEAHILGVFKTKFIQFIFVPPC
jgi:hypothetical protein